MQADADAKLAAMAQDCIAAHRDYLQKQSAALNYRVSHLSRWQEVVAGAEDQEEAYNAWKGKLDRDPKYLELEAAAQAAYNGYMDLYLEVIDVPAEGMPGVLAKMELFHTLLERDAEGGLMFERLDAPQRTALSAYRDLVRVMEAA